MDEPWFRKYFGFGFRPIHWKGWTAIALWLAIAIPSGFLSISTIDPFLGWIADAVFALSGITFFTVGYWKLERHYGS